MVYNLKFSFRCKTTTLRELTGESQSQSRELWTLTYLSGRSHGYLGNKGENKLSTSEWQKIGLRKRGKSVEGRQGIG